MTKVCKCINCGKDVNVTKFASASKVLCDECKGESGGYAQADGVITNPVIDLNKLDRNVVPTLDEYNVTPVLFANRALREVKCPACGHEHMKILKVMDWSTFGLIVHYQCQKCKLLVSISEQCKRTIKYSNDHEMFDYSGETIGAGASSVGNSRMSMAVMKLMKILKENDIKIDKDDIPPYTYDEDRPVPVGYSIPRDDVSIKTIDDTIKILDNSNRINTPNENRYIKIDDTLARQISDKLKNILKDGE